MKMRLFILALLISLAFVVLRSVPIGVVTVDATAFGSDEIVSYSEPQYVIPREIQVLGWPFTVPGRLLQPDPHFEVSYVSSLSKNKEDLTSNLKSAIFCVNPAFANSVFRHCVIVLIIDGSRHQIPIEDLSGTILPSPGSFEILWEGNDQAAFFVLRHTEDFGVEIIVVDTKRNLEIRRVPGPMDSRWNLELDLVTLRMPLEHALKLCDRKLKPLTNLIEESAKIRCS